MYCAPQSSEKSGVIRLLMDEKPAAAGFSYWHRRFQERAISISISIDFGNTSSAAISK